MIKISMTYDVVTPESAEHGDTAENGFEFEVYPHTAHDLANLIKRDGFTVPSDGHGVPRCLSDSGYTDPYTGQTTTKYIHPGRDAQSQRVWAQVLRICGIVKGAQP